MELPLILGLITFLGWGSGDIFTIIAARRIGANLTTFWIFFFSFVLSLVVLLFVPQNFSSITIGLLMLNIFLGILYVSGNVLISEAFRLSSAPLVGIIIQAFPAVVLLLSALVYGDIITPIQYACLAIIFTGVVLCSVDFQKLVSTKKLFDKGTMLALLAMVFLSMFFTFSRVLINAYGWFLPTFIANACFPIIYLFLIIRKEKFSFPSETKVVASVFLVGLLIRAGDFALNYGLSLPNASSIVAPIASAAPILFVVLSNFIFKDKLTSLQKIGIVITLTGIVLLTTIGTK